MHIPGAGTTFLEGSTKVDGSQINAFYFFDVWFSPTASLEHKYSESAFLLGYTNDMQKAASKN